MGEMRVVAANEGVKAVRKALGLTQEQMALELKCSYNTVAKLEQHGRLPKNQAVSEHLDLLARQARIRISVNNER
jgi:DNA-binding transcriptional regulator YiaG